MTTNTCPKCGAEMVECEFCKGSGAASLPIATGVACPHCNGSGVVCPTCGGEQSRDSVTQGGDDG